MKPALCDVEIEWRVNGLKLQEVSFRMPEFLQSITGVLEIFNWRFSPAKTSSLKHIHLDVSHSYSKLLTKEPVTVLYNSSSYVTQHSWLILALLFSMLMLPSMSAYS